MYTSEKQAKTGQEFGGSGFIAGVQSTAMPNMVYTYGITNYHVAVRNGASIARVNKVDGSTEIFPFGPEDWHFDPGAGYDVAVAKLPLKPDEHDYSIVPIEGFLTRELHAREQIAPGDETFMVGRFIDHDGHITNMPAARFGSISINPSKMRSPYFNTHVEMFCLDTNSRTGHSGSPVYVYRTFATDIELLQKPENQGKLFRISSPLFMLLGIHCGQFPEIWNVKNYAEVERISETDESLAYISKAQIVGVSGMTLVVPAWAIVDLLNSPKLKLERDRTEEQLRRIRNPSTPQELTALHQVPKNETGA
jgi:hypothetical protein